jgi:hypothetical protein
VPAEAVLADNGTGISAIASTSAIDINRFLIMEGLLIPDSYIHFSNMSSTVGANGSSGLFGGEAAYTSAPRYYNTNSVKKARAFHFILNYPVYI